MRYETIPCIICNNHNYTQLFSKSFDNSEEFILVKCNGCGLEFVNPRPAYTHIHKYYRDYFTARTDRGYNNYFSAEIQQEVTRVLTLNLADLCFFEFEKSLGPLKCALDIGCAAGYCVDYLSQRGWQSEGIDISQDCIEYANTHLHVTAYCGDFLSFEFNRKYHLITLWATIEHLHNPDVFLDKIYTLLHNDGMLYISTCRSSIFSPRILYGKNWRYYNFPHHLYFFSYTTLSKLLHLKGFTVTRFITYGSGIGKPKTLLRKIADIAAKKLFLGDMMLIAAKKHQR